MLNNALQIPMPPLIERLKRDARGFPVPYVILWDDEGVPHFVINDDRKVEFAIRNNLCAICGYQMPAKNMWLVGGPLSAFHPDGVFNDTAMHYDCAAYALKVCPYLAARKWNVIADNAQRIAARAAPHTPGVIFTDPTMSPGKPEYFALLQISGFQVRRASAFERVIIPNRPYLAVEFWDNGQQIEREIPTTAEMHEKYKIQFGE